jgi:hypothetical protein
MFLLSINRRFFLFNETMSIFFQIIIFLDLELLLVQFFFKYFFHKFTLFSTNTALKIYTEPGLKS